MWLTEEGGFVNYNFTHEQCKQIMNVTDKIECLRGIKRTINCVWFGVATASR